MHMRRVTERDFVSHVPVDALGPASERRASDVS